MRAERHELALTSVVRDLIGTRDGATYFAKKISGYGSAMTCAEIIV